jgi:hypothetical protein
MTDKQPPKATNDNGAGEHDHRAVKTIMRLMHDKGGGPRVYVFLPDGRTTEFETRPLIIPETAEEEADTQLLFLVINGRGEMLVDAKTGKPVVLPEMPLTVQLVDNPNDLVSIKEAARRAGVHESTIKREIKRGVLKPVPVSKRAVRLRVEDLNRSRFGDDA